MPPRRYSKRRSYKGTRKALALRPVRLRRTQGALSMAETRTRFRPDSEQKAKTPRTITSLVPRSIFSREMDRDMFKFTQVCIAKLNWTPFQTSPLGAQGDHGDGFVISMNALVNAFAGSVGVNAGGLPTSPLPSVQGLVFSNIGISGNAAAPDGVAAAMARYMQLQVMGGEFDLLITQDSVGTAAIIGHTDIAVCGFPSTFPGVTYLGGATSGHVMYTSNGASGSNADEQSMALLRAEPNTIHRMLAPYGGGSAEAPRCVRIRYPFRIDKYAQIGWEAFGSFQQTSATASGNPTYAGSQPYILTQFLTTGTQAQTFRVEIRLTTYARGNLRRGVYAL